LATFSAIPPSAGTPTTSAKLAEPPNNAPPATTSPDYAQETFALLRVLVDYLDKLHGSSGFREVLTPDERRDVRTFVSRLPSNPPKN
jgi:hypothetical protein